MSKKHGKQEYYSNSSKKENRSYYQKREKKRAGRLFLLIILLAAISTTSYIMWYNYIFSDAYTLTGIIAPIVVIILIVILKVLKHRKMAGATIKQIDKMGGIEFEKYLYIYYKKRGYKAYITPASGDFGADLIIKDKYGIKTVIQAKRYSSHVGVEAVQQAISSKEYYKADRAAVITNSFYTDPAKEMAKQTGTILIDRYSIGSSKMDL